MLILKQIVKVVALVAIFLVFFGSFTVATSVAANPVLTGMVMIPAIVLWVFFPQRNVEGLLPIGIVGIAGCTALSAPVEYFIGAFVGSSIGLAAGLLIWLCVQLLKLR
jgi:hypothetical protein